MADSESRFEVLWRHVLDHWHDEAAHHAFLQSCQVERRLADAAARYRGMAADRTRGATAERNLQAILVMAMSAMETERNVPAQRHSKLPLLLASASLGLALLISYLALF